MRPTGQPLASQGVDLGRPQTIADLLQAVGIGTSADAVVQSLKGDIFLGQLPLGVFVPIDAELGIVGEVGAELEKEQAEVLVDAIEVKSD